jgi:hypothetical protein
VDKMANKVLYSQGDRCRSGQKIDFVYYASNQCIFFRGVDGGLGWEIDGLCAAHQSALQRMRQLMVDAQSSLAKSRWVTVHQMLVSAMSTLMSSAESFDAEEAFKPAKDYIEKHRHDVAASLANGPGFAVYRMKSGRLSWHYQKLPEALAPAVEEFERLNSLVNAVMPKAHKAAASEMLGTALGACFRMPEGRNVEAAFEGARDFIISQTIASVRVRMFIVGVGSTFLLMLLLVALDAWSILDRNHLAAVGAGALGAMVSALQRNGEMEVNPYGNRLALYSESLSRLLVGAVFGLFVLLAAQGDLALTAFKTNPSAMLLFSFIGGFTERFVPDLITSASGKA